jgi:hypothetical protein
LQEDHDSTGVVIFIVQLINQQFIKGYSWLEHFLWIGATVGEHVSYSQVHLFYGLRKKSAYNWKDKSTQNRPMKTLKQNNK